MDREQDRVELLSVTRGQATDKEWSSIQLYSVLRGWAMTQSSGG